MDIEFRLQDEVLKRQLQRVPKEFDRLEQPFSRAGQFILDETDKNFSSRGSYFNKKWKRRSPSYEKKATWPILEKTGDMRSDFDFVALRNQLRVFNLDRKFKYHQSSAPRTSNLPRRQMLVLTKKIKAQIVREIQITARKILTIPR